MPDRSIFLPLVEVPGPPERLKLAGGWAALAGARRLERGPDGAGRVVEVLDDEALRKRHPAAFKRLAAARRPWAGLSLGRPHVMGIVNVTPDSFSDGGERLDPGRAIAAGLAMVEAGAAIVDVGGESTRPGAEAVTEDEEIRRVEPVVRGLAAAGVRVSLDTRHAAVMRAAVEAGATIVNDVTALRHDPEALGVVAACGASVVLMHMQGEPRTMQAAPRYQDVVLEVYEHLAGRVAACEAAGIERERIAVDPGIGFGKTLDHNLELLDCLAAFHGLGCAVVLGASRKSFIHRLSASPEAKQRLPGSLAAALAGVARGTQILRVHDVAETVQALAVWQAVNRRAAPEFFEQGSRAES